MRVLTSFSIRPAILRSTMLFCIASTIGITGFARGSDSLVSVRINSDESEAVLSLLLRTLANQSLREEDWQRIFSSEGYIRLKKREASLHREFTDSEFKGFVLSDSLVGRYQQLRTTLDKWKRIDVTAAAKRSLAYLPQGASIKATIYPVIKPKTNSFVFETTTDPAIFLYLDPAMSADKFENTIAHELHHAGYAQSCEALSRQLSADTTLPQSSRTVLEWIGAFGEGIAMLAAAGGPDIHPHAVSKPEDRARWDRDMVNYNTDLKKVDRFFIAVLDGKLSPEEIQRTAFSFFGIQGPWYTVGWKMAVTIEKTYGRARLIECICDPRLLLTTYNNAALQYNGSRSVSLATWSPSLMERIAR